MNISIHDLGLMDYKSCWNLQQSLFEELLRTKSGAHEATTPHGAAAASSCTDTEINSTNILSLRNADTAGCVLLVEHPPVYTLGKSGHMENLLIDRPALEKLGATFFHIDRGGDITFHGPGQLVCYPILDLEKLGIGLRRYIEILEEAVIRTVAHYGIRAGRIAGASGVWMGGETVCSDGQPETRPTLPRKVCAIGVRSSRFVTMHGFALNVSTDLNWFMRINPCGFTDRGATSIERECGHTVSMEEVKELIVKHLSEILNVKIYK